MFGDEGKSNEFSKELLQCTFSPKISAYPNLPDREGTITDFLYQDAKRRKVRIENGCSNEMQKSLESNKFGSAAKQSSAKKSVDYALNKFFREFSKVALAITKGEHRERLDLFEMVEIIRGLEFLQEEPNNKESQTGNKKTKENKANSEFIERIWTELEGKKFNYIYTRNLLVFLAAVVGIIVTEEKLPRVEERTAEVEGGETLFIKKV